MTDDPTNSLAAANRVSIRAVLAADGEDVTQALAEAGIVDPVAVPVLLGEAADPAGGILGDGITPNLTGVLEPDDPDDTGPSSDTVIRPGQTRADAGQDRPITVMLPAAGGMQPLAPVRKRGP